MKLSAFPALNIIRLYRGHVDFYYWKNIPVARRWPTFSGQPNSPAQQQTKNNFTLMHTLLRDPPQGFTEAWEAMSPPTHRSLEDLRRKVVLRWLNGTNNTQLFYIRRLWRDPPPPSADYTVHISVDAIPEIDYTQIEWLYFPYESNAPRLPWIPDLYRCLRPRVPETDFILDWTGWILAPDVIWDPDFRVYQWDYSSDLTHLAVIARYAEA